MTYTLYELNEYIRRILALNLSEALWIRAEIMQLNEARGHYFIELVQKSEQHDDLIAQASAVIWQGTFRQMRSKIGRLLADLLQEGVEVQLKVRVDFHERYGLKLVIEDIDPAYTLGQLEMRRRQTLDTLRQEGYFGKNAALPLPIVLQRIAVISSERAAGYQDFLQHLKENIYGYTFDCQLFETAMQGEQVEPELLRQLKNIARQRERFDCVVIIRGGGARFDLAAFDRLPLCKGVAELPLPVLTGIGHDVDETVLDQVAYAALKTPTAVADFLLQRNLSFENRLQQQGNRLHLTASQILHNQQLAMQNLQRRAQWGAMQKVHHAKQRLALMAQELPRQSRFQIDNAGLHLEQLSKVVALLGLEATLQRGFTYTSKNGKIIHSAAEIAKNDSIKTHFCDGIIESKVNK
ncbi:MAG TPA: exodeoxyribonuclease VII large subunit [Saprospiraceae bacterium]|nr:exodeoxyribonuclease VII large subunit [Saprospiraceae bacterium]HMP14594.1 exodeoxyribonuclease VII large subunit [Saprospiraceae bacterium]